MKKKLNYTLRLSIILLFINTSLFAQVGIGNTSPNTNALLEVGDGTDTGGIILPRVTLASTTSFSPLSAHVEGMMVYNTVSSGTGYTAVTPGQYYNDGTKWIRVGAEEKPIDSVSLATDIEISASSFTDISGMNLTFTARKSSVLVLLSASGHGYTNSVSLVQFRIRNTTTSTTIGGTMNKIQNNYNPTLGSTYTVTTWSASFSKQVSGLTVGSSYTLQVQGLADGVLGTYNAVISPTTQPDSEHLTLNVIQ